MPFLEGFVFGRARLIKQTEKGNNKMQTTAEIVRERSLTGRQAWSRQHLPTLERSKYGGASSFAEGAHVLADSPGGNPQLTLIASRSEVGLAVEAHEKPLAEGIRSRVVPVPSWEILEQQTRAYRESVLRPNIAARISIEQTSTFGWEGYVGENGRMIGMKTFGASAPLRQLQGKFGFEPGRIAGAPKDLPGTQGQR
jgi:transketolase